MKGRPLTAWCKAPACREIGYRLKFGLFVDQSETAPRTRRVPNVEPKGHPHSSYQKYLRRCPRCGHEYWSTIR